MPVLAGIEMVSKRPGGLALAAQDGLPDPIDFMQAAASGLLLSRLIAG
jgi:hypothetical protein